MPSGVAELSWFPWVVLPLLVWFRRWLLHEWFHCCACEWGEFVVVSGEWFFVSVVV